MGIAFHVVVWLQGTVVCFKLDDCRQLGHAVVQFDTVSGKAATYNLRYIPLLYLEEYKAYFSVTLVRNKSGVTLYDVTTQQTAIFTVSHSHSHSH